MIARDYSPRTLRARRLDADTLRFQPRFFEKDPRFWPIAAAASAFRDHTDWPEVSDYTLAFAAAGRAPSVVFELQPPKPRRTRKYADGTSAGGNIIDIDAGYDGRITLARRVPTRARQWHDFLNAMVWATFPAAKAALHARQYAVLREHVPTAATRMPNARTREHDALALMDEGGVIAFRDKAFIFGHALYEGMVLGGRAMIARAWETDVPFTTLQDADLALARSLTDRAIVWCPEVLGRIALDSPLIAPPTALDGAENP